MFAFSLLAFGFAGWLIADDQHASPDLTVHEWGTFTAIAGKDGRAAEWLPLGLPRYPPSTDLPQFVEHINGVTLGLETSTVKHHINSAADKLDVHSRILLALYWSFPLFRIGAGRDDHPSKA